MELSAVGDRVFAAEAILKRRVRKVSSRAVVQLPRRDTEAPTDAFNVAHSELAASCELAS